MPQVTFLLMRRISISLLCPILFIIRQRTELYFLIYPGLDTPKILIPLILLSTAGPTSLEDYFQKGAQNLWYLETRPNSKKNPSPPVRFWGGGGVAPPPLGFSESEEKEPQLEKETEEEGKRRISFLEL